MVGNPTSTVDLERPRAVVTVEFQQQKTEENMHGVQVLLGQPSHPVNPKKQKRCDYPIEPTSNLFFGSTLDSLVGNWVTQNNLVQGLAQQLTIKLIQLWDSPINRTEQSSQCSQLDKGNIAIDMDK